MAERPSVVIWGDGSGSTFKATLDAIHEGIVAMDVVGVISADAGAGILDHATRAREIYHMDIEPLIVPGLPGRRQTEETQRKVLDFMFARGSGNLALMGAMVIVGDTIVEALNGEVQESVLPKNIEEARTLMVPDPNGHGFYLPASFVAQRDTEKYGVTNTHPAPTIVTANTHGKGSQERMVRLGARENAVTYHAVGTGIDTGIAIAINRFPVTPPRVDASDSEIKETARIWFQMAQRIEKAHLPMDVEAQARLHDTFLRRAA